jgi:uncharacterized membrane protein (DUF2068 family)
MLMSAQHRHSSYPVWSPHPLAEVEHVKATAWREVPAMSTPAPVKTRAHVSSSERWIVVIGIWKLLEAALLLILGIGALKLLHKDLVDVVTRFIIDIGRDPEGHFANLLLDKVALIDPHRLKQISIAIFAGATLHLVEGVGLVLRKTWAEYVTLILTASFLPWEVIEIIRHTTWIKIGLLLLNLAVVVYLVFYVQTSIRRRGIQQES